MHILDAAMAAALMNRRQKLPMPSPDELSREGGRSLARLALALAIVAGFVASMEVASRAMPSAGAPQVATERPR